MTIIISVHVLIDVSEIGINCLCFCSLNGTTYDEIREISTVVRKGQIERTSCSGGAVVREHTFVAARIEAIPRHCSHLR